MKPIARGGIVGGTGTTDRKLVKCTTLTVWLSLVGAAFVSVLTLLEIYGVETSGLHFQGLSISCYSRIITANASDLPQQPSGGSLTSVPGLPTSTTNKSCCFDCDIAELKVVGKQSTLLGCPRMDQGLNPLALSDLSKLHEGKPLWIATVGDSVLRNPFTWFPGTIMGPHWHYQERAYNKTWYHNDQVFCCKNRHDISTCMYGRQAYEFEPRVDRFVQTYLESSWAGICWSFSFNGRIDNVQPLMQEYAAYQLPPAMVIVNPGLHHALVNNTVEEYEGALSALFANITAWQRKAGESKASSIHTRYVYHTTTMMDDSKMKIPNNNLVLAYNEVVYRLAKRLGRALAEANIVILDAYRLTSMGDVTIMSDGFHYDGHYLDLINILQLNFLYDKEVYGFCLSRYFVQDCNANVSRPL